MFQGRFNRDIALNNDCMDFHETINTDLNRWIYKGVTYIQNFDYEKVKKTMQEADPEEKNDAPVKDTSDSLSESDKETFDRIKSDYAAFCKDATAGAEFSVLVSKGAVRKCFYEVIEDQTPDYYTTTKEAAPNNWREKIIQVKKTTKEEKDALKKEVEKKKEEEFNSSLGFLRVWHQILSYKKPIVGHNCFMDLMFVFEHFHKNNPQQFKKYKETLKETWSQVYDTKVLASEMKIEGMGSFMNLEELYAKLCDTTNIKIACAEGMTNYAERLSPEQLKEKGAESGFHSAGYDAFVTGSCFYMMSKLSDGSSTIENFKNKIRLGGNRLFMADLGNPDADEDISDVAKHSDLESLLGGSDRQVKRCGQVRAAEDPEGHLGVSEGRSEKRDQLKFPVLTKRTLRKERLRELLLRNRETVLTKHPVDPERHQGAPQDQEGREFGGVQC